MKLKHRWKRIISLCLAACLMFGMCTIAMPEAFAYPEGYANTHTNTGNQRSDVVAIARTQVGYHEDSSGTKYGAWWKSYTNSSYNFTTAAWCVMFVLWCQYQSGCTDATKGMSAAASSLLSKYQNGKNGCTAYGFKSGYTPKPGDIIFVGYSGNSSYTDHVGLIVEVTDSTIYTIEGNYNDQVSNVKYSTSSGCRPNSSRCIVAYGVAPYANSSGSSSSGSSTPENDDDIVSTAVNYTAKVTATTLNVRVRPSTNSTVTKVMNKGDAVSVVAEAEDEAGNKWGKLSGGGWVSLAYLSQDVAAATGGNTGGTSGSNGGSSSESVILKGVITASALNIRSDASSSGKITGSLKKGTAVEIVELKKDSSGTQWGRLKQGGWISTAYVGDSVSESTSGSSSSSGTSSTVTGVVTATTLNVRKTASTSGTIVTTLKKGATVTILSTKTVSGKKWGQVSNGWVSMEYISLNGVTETVTKTGTITANGLYVRNAVGTGTVVGTLTKGTKVTITETTTYNGSTWGKISSGWICLDYVDFSGVIQAETGSSSGSSSGSSGTGSSSGSGTGSTSGGSAGSTGSSSSSSSGTTETVYRTGKTTASSLNVRSAAGNGSIVSKYSYGTKVTITAVTTVNGVQWGKTSAGWISMQYVKLDNVTTGTITGSYVNVRSGAGSSYSVLKQLAKGTKVEIVETSGSGSAAWGHLSTGGWVSMQYVKKS